MDKMKKMLKKKALRRVGGKRGFTLVELLIVMTIIAILVGIVVLSLSGFLGVAQETVCEADQRSLQSAVVAFWVFNGAASTDWPTTAGTILGRIDYTVVDDDGNVFQPDYILEVPDTDTAALWTINANGVVEEGAGGDCTP